MNLSTQDTQLGWMVRSLQMIHPDYKKNVTGEIMPGEPYMH